MKVLPKRKKRDFSTARHPFHLSKAARTRLRLHALAQRQQQQQRQQQLQLQVESCIRSKRRDKRIRKTDKLVLRHLKEVGIGRELVDQVKEALTMTAVTRSFPTTKLEKMLKFANLGKFDLEVSGINGHLGSLEVKAVMTMDELSEAIRELTGIPVIQQRLTSGTHVLRSGRSIIECGLSPTRNHVTVLRTMEYPENPTFSFKSLTDLLPGRRLPRGPGDWLRVQSAVWPGYPPLKTDWIRVVSRTNFTTFFVNVQTRESTFDYDKVRAEES